MNATDRLMNRGRRKEGRTTLKREGEERGGSKEESRPDYSTHRRPWFSWTRTRLRYATRCNRTRSLDALALQGTMERRKENRPRLKLLSPSLPSSLFPRAYWRVMHTLAAPLDGGEGEGCENE